MPGILQAQVQTYTCPAPGGFGPVIAAPPILVTSLKSVPNPVYPKVDPVTLKFDVSDPATGLVIGPPTLRADLSAYVANVDVAIRLGKALFWDMQSGSDNKTACATCHFKAGADGRWINQTNPGANLVTDPTTGAYISGWDIQHANYSLAATDFPFTLGVQGAPGFRDLDNISGSQGVRRSTFKGISTSGKTAGQELTTAVADPVFSVGGVNVRRTTGKNTPPIINAVFNHRNFWNGRAQAEFNGANPFGNRDASARVWTLDFRGNPVAVNIQIPDASLASQAVGPPLNDTEMSAAGRTFPDLGRKMLLAKPLGLQTVDPTDSVFAAHASPFVDVDPLTKLPLSRPALSSIVDAKGGLTASYKTLISQAFQPKWWNSNKNISINGKSYSMMEANFPLYWGIAIMLYEATLVADSSPLDQYLESRRFYGVDNLTGNLVAIPAKSALATMALDKRTGLPLLQNHTPALLDQVVARLTAEGITKSNGAAVTAADFLAGLNLFEMIIAPPTNPAAFPPILAGPLAYPNAPPTLPPTTLATIDPLTGAIPTTTPFPFTPVVDPLTGVVTQVPAIIDPLTGLPLPLQVAGSVTVGLAPQATWGFGVECSACHVSGELTSSSVRNLSVGLEVGAGLFRKSGFDLRMERMFMRFAGVPFGTNYITFDPATYTVTAGVCNLNPDGTPVLPLTCPVPPTPINPQPATYDVGWYNLGVRPTADDAGLGGPDPFGNGLSWTKLFQAFSDPTVIKVPGGGLGCGTLPLAGAFAGTLLNPTGFPLLSGPMIKTEPTDVDGTFKVASLRNLELTGPYFHNGGKSTLKQVLDFYDDGGQFANFTKAPAIVPLGMDPVTQQDALVALLLALTDERVRLEQAPFDHPSLVVPNGAVPSTGTSSDDTPMTIPAVGAGGSLPGPTKRFLDLNPFLF